MAVVLEARASGFRAPYILDVYPEVRAGLLAALQEIDHLEDLGFVLEHFFEQDGVVARWRYSWPEEHELDQYDQPEVLLVDADGGLAGLAGLLRDLPGPLGGR